MNINIKSYNQLKKNENLLKKTREILKYYFIKLVNNRKFVINDSSIFFPFYHHVFDDEIKNFNLQIKFLKNYGDFISYDDSIKIINEGLYKKNIYFCLSFDDGFKNMINNVTEILLNLNIPATYFIPTSFIDNNRDDGGNIFFNNENINIDFLDWNDCKKICSEKLFTIGSHSINHKLISRLSYEESLNEMKFSKKKIEEKLSIICDHFAPPLGDFIYSRDSKIAKEIGYKSISTTVRGKMDKNNKNIFFLYRHHFLANWEINYLKYFLSK